MSRRGGGSANPFSRTVQASGPAASTNQRQQQQPTNAPRGPPSQAGRNPFAPQAQQPFAQPQPNQQQFQQRNQSFQKGQQGGRQQHSSNPFANRSGDSGSMEMESGADFRGNQGQTMQTQARAGAAYPPRGQVGNIFAGHNQSNQRSNLNQQSQQQGSRNPFATSSGSAHPMVSSAAPAPGRNPFAPSAQQHQQHGGPALFQQPTPFQPMQPPLNPLGHLNTPQMFTAQHQQPHLSTVMSGNTFFQQQPHQAQPSAQPTSFFTAGARGGAMNNAPPPTAAVNAETLGAVNVSAALAPNKVEDIDLGLGLGAPSLPAPITTGTVPSLHSASGPALTQSSTAGASAAGSGAPTGATEGDTLQQATQALLTQILSSNPAALLTEPPAHEDPYTLMAAAGKLELVAGRIPSAPPQRKAAKHGAGAGGAQRGTGLGVQPGATANPFFGGGAGVAAGGGNSIFGKPQ